MTVSAYGMPADFINAFREILLGARDCYTALFGGDRIGRVEMNIRKSPSLPLRLWTNGADRIFLTLSSKDQLNEPSLSGVFYLHGLPHELGHIVLYRSLINLNILPDGWGEGWAIYVSSFLAVPHLYATRGPELWPYPYDYLSTEGPATILRRIASTSSAKLSPELSVVATLHRLKEKLGAAGFGCFFAELLASPIRSDVFVRAVLSKASGPAKSHRLRGVSRIGAGPA